MQRPDSPSRGPLAVLALALSACMPAHGATPIYEIQLRNHLYLPSAITIPANTKVRLAITNNDPTPEEFESYQLNREKLIVPGARAIVFIGPLKPGEYPFFGEFFPKTAQGKVIVKAAEE